MTLTTMKRNLPALFRLFVTVLLSVSVVLPFVFQTLAEEIVESKKCKDLLLGQYLCAEPEIDPDTQQPRGCSKDKKVANVTCKTAPEVVCDGSTNVTFQLEVPCKWTNGHSFETALLLSVFLGMFGVDRFYLGYPAIGLLKFATLGFMFLGQLIDILLIATQVLGPSDGSSYVLDYYGAATARIIKDNDTYLFPGD